MFNTQELFGSEFKFGVTRVSSLLDYLLKSEVYSPETQLRALIGILDAQGVTIANIQLQENIELATKIHAILEHPGISNHLKQGGYGDFLDHPVILYFFLKSNQTVSGRRVMSD